MDPKNTNWRDFSFSGNYINGRFVIPESPSFTVEKLNPADLDDHISTIPIYYPHCEEAVNRASEAFPAWSHLHRDKRLEILKNFKSSIEMLSTWLVELIARELGRPIWDAKEEVHAALSDMDALFEHFPTYAPNSELYSDSFDHVVEIYKPQGVIAIIAPFNQPVMYPLRSIIGALLMGNTVVFKPSELSPMLGQIIAEAAHEAELPKGVFNMVHGEKEISKRIITHRKVSAVFFNGNFETGSKVAQYIADDYWKLLIMGTGGRNAAIVMPDCKLESTVEEIIVGAFMSTGQRSNGIRRVFVHSQIADDFIEKFHGNSKKLKIGHPLDEYKGNKPFMGPLISETAKENYLRLQGIGLREGAELIMRAKEIDIEAGHRGYYVTPSIHITDNLNEAGIYNTSEIFGPNVSIKRFTGIDELIASHNSCGYGYGLSIFCQDKKFLSKLIEHCDVGQVFINSNAFHESVRYPIAGYGKSGNSHPEGRLIVNYLRKSVVVYNNKEKENG